MRVLDLPRRRYSMPETVMRKYRLRQRAESTSESSSGGGRRRRMGVDKSSQTSPRESLGRTGSYPSLATPSPRAWSCVTSDCQTVSDKTNSTQDSTLSVPSTNSESSYRAEDIQTQVSLPHLKDRTTSITGLAFGDTVVHVGVDIKTQEATVICEQPTETMKSIAIQADNSNLFRIPEISVMKDSTESQSGLSIIQMKEESSQVSKRDILEEMGALRLHIRKVQAEVSCVGGNYEDYPIENPVVPRYSAVPRTNSMLVNTSSIEYYSSDSDLSLTDSLEDPEEYRIQTYKRKQTRHDDRLVRGEVSVEQERRRLPKARDAYAYFLTLTGEEDTIREYSIPDWLRERLRRREEEIKKVYEDKLSRHQQCGYFRRRKKVVKRFKQRNSYSSSEKIKKNEIIMSDPHPKNDKTVHFNEYGTNNINNNNINPSTSDKCAIRLLNGNNMRLEPKIDNIHRNNNHHNNGNNNNNNNNNNEGNSNQLFLQSETGNRNNGNPNLLQISEVIKIEMADNLRTVITKEKQINLAPDTTLKQSTSETIKNELSNSSKSVITKSSSSHVSAEITDTNTLHSYRQTNMTPRKSENIEETPKESREVKQETKEEEPAVPSCSKFREVSEAVVKKDDSESKIELDRKIADILISALEENTKVHQLCRTSESEQTPRQKTETSFESHSKILVQQESQKNEMETEEESPKTCCVEVQTDEIEDKKNEKLEERNTSDKSCNTEAYLVSVLIQTSDQDNNEQEETDDGSYNSEFESFEDEATSCNIESAISSFESNVDENVKMVDKACNTVESSSISTQTNESFLQNEDILNGFKSEKKSKRKDVQFPPQVIKQIITGTGEYMTVEESCGRGKDINRGRSSGGKKSKVSKGTNTEETEPAVENNKNIINNNVDMLKIRTAPTPFCKNVFPGKSQQKKSQVLELNVPACTCHMCTLQKISPRSSRIPQTKKIECAKEDKKSSKYGSRRANVIGSKFKMFEVIPEEKTSSGESIPEENKQEEKRGKITMEEKAILTDPHLVDQIVQVGSHIASVATNTEPEQTLVCERVKEGSTQTSNTKTEVTQTESKQCGSTQTVSTTQRKSNLVIGRFRSENRESPVLVRQYKGRASLSTAQTEGQEELLTLSKGWINFYLLKDNFDFSDSNAEEPPSGSSRRRVRTIEHEEDKVEEYTLEIHATPEPKSGLMPTLKRSGCPGVSLPELQTSSSSSTPEGLDQRKSAVEKKAAVEPLPGVKRSKKTKRSQINMKREAITETRRDGSPPATRSIEVARSEQSISSITSSTVILSESPPPQQLKLPDKRSQYRPRVHRSYQKQPNNGSSWTVTVAGSSGSGNDPPPDVEMKLSFAKQSKRQEEALLQYQVARPKRQGQMIEQFSHVARNEKHAVQSVQDLSLQAHHPKSSYERTRGGTAKDIFCYEEDYINRLSSRSRYSTEDGSETAADLHVTGLAITPEKKPRVPTQSERDILRPQRYKFTR